MERINLQQIQQSQRTIDELQNEIINLLENIEIETFNPNENESYEDQMKEGNGLYEKLKTNIENIETILNKEETMKEMFENIKRMKEEMKETNNSIISKMMEISKNSQMKKEEYFTLRKEMIKKRIETKEERNRREVEEMMEETKEERERIEKILKETEILYGKIQNEKNEMVKERMSEIEREMTKNQEKNAVVDTAVKSSHRIDCVNYKCCAMMSRCHHSGTEHGIF